jgi:hypothetical protein
MLSAPPKPNIKSGPAVPLRESGPLVPFLPPLAEPPGLVPGLVGVGVVIVILAGTADGMVLQSGRNLPF